MESSLFPDEYYDFEDTEREQDSDIIMDKNNINTRSAEDIKNFLALDVANCKVERSYYLHTILIQVEYLAPKWKKVQGLFLQEHSKRLSYLQLEISKACRNMLDGIITDLETNSVKVTMRDKHNNYPVMRTREWEFDRLEEQQEPVKENASHVSQVVIDHLNYACSLFQRQFLPNNSDSDGDVYVMSDNDEDEDEDEDVAFQRDKARFLKKLAHAFTVA